VVEVLLRRDGVRKLEIIMDELDESYDPCVPSNGDYADVIRKEFIEMIEKTKKPEQKSFMRRGLSDSECESIHQAILAVVIYNKALTDLQNKVREL
jgi:hypothetical protein